MMMGVVDSIMVGRLSKDALAAVAVGNFYYFAGAIFGMGVIMAVDPIISQAVGARDEHAIATALQRGFAIALALSVLMAPFLWLAEPVLRALRQPAEIIGPATLYARIMIPGALPFFLFMVLRQSLQSMSVIAPTVIAIVVSNLANGLLNWTLIYGHLGSPALGVAGAAWATSISRVILLATLTVVAWRHFRTYLAPHRETLHLKPLLRMLRIGAPIGLHHVLEYGAFASVMAIMGTLGTVALASHQVAINLASLTFMVPLGVAQAAGVLVGQAVGRNADADARRAAGAGLLAGVSFMALMAIVFLVAPRLLASVYTRDTAVIALTVSLIRLAGVFQVFDGLQVVCTGILRGVADTRVPMIIGLLGFWMFGMPISVWLGLGHDMGAVGLWWGLVAGLAAVALVLTVRMFQRLSQDLSRVVIDEPMAISAVSIERLD